MPKQFIGRWLIDLLDAPEYRDDREMKAEQQTIRKNARAEVGKIWDEQAKKLAPPAPIAPLPPPDWGTPAPPPVVSDPLPPPIATTPPPLAPAPTPAPVDPGVASRLSSDYWANDPRPQGQIETIS